MLDHTTWEKAMGGGQAAIHGATGVKLDLNNFSSINDVGVNSVMVSEESEGFEISLEVCFTPYRALTREQVVEKLRELDALDEDWE